MNGVIVKNRYYSDNGQCYVIKRLIEEFGAKKVPLGVQSICFGYDENCGYVLPQLQADFIMFFDKDAALSQALEKKYPLFNTTSSLVICDDKEKTFAAVEGMGIRVPKTVNSPLMFEANSSVDEKFIDDVEKYLGYPMVVKEKTGSLGVQVYLARNRQELIALRKKLLHKPHIYQAYAGNFGRDIRIYVVGGKAVAACKRENELSFKSNISAGGKMELIKPSLGFIDAAQAIAQKIGMDYGSVDFADCETPVFLEANSNAYFRAIEKLGENIAEKIASHVISKLC